MTSANMKAPSDVMNINVNCFMDYITLTTDECISEIYVHVGKMLKVSVPKFSISCLANQVCRCNIK